MKKNRAAAFHRVISEAADHQLLNDEDVESLRYVVESLNASFGEGDQLQAVLEEQAQLRATVGYYSQWFKRQAKAVETGVDRKWLQLYNETRKLKYDKTLPKVRKEDEAGRFSEKLVTSKAVQDPTYTSLQNQAQTYRYFADQLDELKAAIHARTRLLEQYSNNSRVQARVDLDEE